LDILPRVSGSTSHRIRTPANAATAAVLALGLLAVGLNGPFLAVTTLGTPGTHSLLGGIADLAAEGSMGLATIIAVFSVAFPVAKNLLVIAATTVVVPLSPAARRTLLAVAGQAGKYSLLDVLVVALLVVTLKSQPFVEIRAGWALWAFAASVACSIAATHLLPPSPPPEPEP
jgi:paraquat-inducible protein A